MPSINIPRSNEDLIRFFETAPRIATEDKAAGVDYLDDVWHNAASAYYLNFTAKVRGLTVAQQNRAQQVEERRAVIDRLEVYVRDYLNVFKRMVYREGLSATVFAFYSLPESGDLPNPRTIDDILSWAEKIVKGDADAVAAGFPAMGHPSAEQVSVLLAQAKAEGADISAAERTLDTALDEVESLRAQGYALAQDAEQQLNFQLRKLDAPDRRRIIRRYAFTYTYAASETPDPA